MQSSNVFWVSLSKHCQDLQIAKGVGTWLTDVLDGVPPATVDVEAFARCSVILFIVSQRAAVRDEGTGAPGVLTITPLAKGHSVEQATFPSSGKSSKQGSTPGVLSMSIQVLTPA
jgi:hypothetical protein